ncbi:MAG TPA: PHB depolymerase family esterase [Rhodocyclaceae bacterium]
MPTPATNAVRLLLLATLVGASTTDAVEPLPALAANAAAVTVSGISSGGYMAVQYQVAHSQTVSGAAVLAGGPYQCAEGSLWRAMRNCMTPSDWSPAPDLARQLSALEHAARAGKIDQPEGLRDDRVWLLSGGNDHTVERPVVDALAAFYEHWTAAGALRYLKPPDPGHAMISATDAEANACVTTDPPFINRCPDPDGTGLYDAPKEMLRHLLGPPPEPAAGAGQVVEFDQSAFVRGRPDDAGLAAAGFAYVPAACRQESCRIHVAFHGCRQSAAQIGRRYIDKVGYNAWADRYGLIVLYPQTVPRSGFAFGSWRWLYNPKACWDWWGYTGSDYATREGSQIKAVKAMIDRLGSVR